MLNESELHFLESSMEDMSKIGKYKEGTILTFERTLMGIVAMELQCNRYATYALRIEELEDQIHGTLDIVLCSEADTFRARYGIENAIGRSMLNSNPNVVITRTENLIEDKTTAFQALLQLAKLRTRKINSIVEEYNEDIESIEEAYNAVEDGTAEQLGEILH